MKCRDEQLCRTNTFSSFLTEVETEPDFSVSRVSFASISLEPFPLPFLFLERKQTEKVQSSYVPVLLRLGVFVKRELGVSLQLVDVCVEHLLKLLGPSLLFHQEALCSQGSWEGYIWWRLKRGRKVRCDQSRAFSRRHAPS